MREKSSITCSCMYFLPMFMFIYVILFLCLHVRFLEKREALMMFVAVQLLSFLHILKFLCKKSVIIKQKSRDLSGSASLALWANMNQSTTQLGSKRQSEGKHLYPTFKIFLCRAVSLCPVSMEAFLSFFFIPFSSVWFAWFLFHILKCCLQPSCSPGEFIWSSCESVGCSPLACLFFPIIF